MNYYCKITNRKNCAIKNTIVQAYIATILITSLFIFSSCDKTVELFDEYKDITIVYGLINPKDSISYIRIEKAFLSAENIYQTAKIPDSNLYSHKLDVKVLSGNQIIEFDTITVYNKKEGIFYAPKMQVYYAGTINRLDINQPLLLEIKNPKSGEIIRSKTNLHNSSAIRVTVPMYFISFEKNSTFSFETIADISIYQPYIRFHYMEQVPNEPNTAVFKYVDWPFPFVTSRTLFGGESINVPVVGVDFYSNLLKTIPSSNSLERYHGKIEFVIATSEYSFYAYHESYQPSSTVVMNRGVYTNIENGYGVFSGVSSGGKYIRINNQSKTRIRNLEGLNFVGGLPEE
ncbi:hypothetical protein [Lentimicrobium sp. S6]|uniref:hypothetical protein n=1 Tax=Lentimicrobium sp. S6 TaxID=2735872 RepID=UPI0015564061|nr:hypothetical protein [Lentimicrobium sp. S6]NPD47352.1 hypothetical protein [Lentimicrobium sp. S6]